MNKIIKFIKENKLLIIIALLTILFIVYQMINSYIDNNTINVLDENIETKTKYDANEFSSIREETIDLINAYFKRYLNLILNNKEEAFKMLTSDTQKDFHASISEYEEYLKNIKYDNTTKVSEYRINEDGSYYIVDTLGNKYRIYENGIWNIQIEIK